MLDSICAQPLFKPLGPNVLPNAEVFKFQESETVHASSIKKMLPGEPPAISYNQAH